MHTKPLATPHFSLHNAQHLAADGRWQGLAHVLGMHCGACSLVLEAKARGVSGLDQLDVNPATGLACWVASKPTAIEAFAQRIQTLGYGLSPWAADGNAQEMALAHAQKQLRHLFLRALVALLCMMQIMMYSAPEYLYSAEAIGTEALMLLRWAQWVLSLPLLLYCAQPFLQRAWQAARAGCWAMDQPIALGLLLAFVASAVQMHNPTKPVWFDCLGMLLTVLLASQWLNQRRCVQALQTLTQHPLDLPSHVDCKSNQGANTRWQKIAVAQLQAGDCFTLPANTVCPVDAQIGHEQAPVWVDETLRTGEPTPVYKQAGDRLWAGSRVLSEGAVLVAMHSAAHSSLAKLGQDLQHALAQKPKHMALQDRLLPHWSAAIMLCAGASAAVWGYAAGASQASAVAVAVLLISCPCALALAQPLVHLMAMQRLQQLGIVVRQPNALVVLAQTDCVAFDKTGTLSPRQAAHVQCTALIPNPQLLSPQPKALLHALAQYISQASAHPVAQAIRTHLVHQSPQAHPSWPLSAIQEIPSLGLEALWQLNNHKVRVRLGAVTWCGLGPMPHANTQPNAKSYAALDVRVVGGPVLGQLHFTLAWQQLDTQAHAALKSLCANTKVVMLSGDTQAATEAWQPDIPLAARIGGMQAQDKTAWVQKQQRQGRVVAMVGDGLNDSSAFAAANVAFAVHGAAHMAAVQADFILTQPKANSNTPSEAQPRIHPAVQVAQAIPIAQKARTLTQQNLAWALLYNVLAIPLAASGQLQPWMAALGMGLSSLAVLANAMRLRL